MGCKRDAGYSSRVHRQGLRGGRAGGAAATVQGRELVLGLAPAPRNFCHKHDFALAPSCKASKYCQRMYAGKVLLAASFLGERMRFPGPSTWDPSVRWLHPIGCSLNQTWQELQPCRQSCYLLEV
eukprot:scaffold393_cov554-Prasinococcus_capsulatus_cf.AAC.1